MKRFLTDAVRRWEETPVTPRRVSGTPEMNLVKVYPDIRKQHLIGFGAALTESSGYVFSRMDAETQGRFLELCFGEAHNRYSLARISIQSCDFSLTPRSYLPKRDDALSGFSIDDDWAYVIPLIKAAQQINPNLEFIATPWSPPAWAKTNRTMKHGGHLRKDMHEVWARMIAQTLRAYGEIGIPIGRITVQNEPNAHQIWESCLFDAEQERDFLHNHLKPALTAAGLAHVKTLVWDHNKEGMLDRALPMLADPATAHDVDGIAFHWYSGDHFEALAAAREIAGAERELIFTEGCDSYSAGDVACELPHAEHYAHEVIGDLEAGANGIIDWNILLDEHGGPNHVGNFCDAPIMYNGATRALNVRLPFYYLGHFSRFMQPGARRMLVSRYITDLETCGVVNPDGSYALVVLNRTGQSIRFDLAGPAEQRKARIVHLDAPPHSIQTIIW